MEVIDSEKWSKTFVIFGICLLVKNFSAAFLENPFIRKVLIAETAFFTADLMVVRSDPFLIL